MEPENPLPQNDTDSTIHSDSGLPSVQDVFSDRVDAIAQTVTVLSHKTVLSERRNFNQQAQIDNINHHLDAIEKRLNAIDEYIKARNAQLEGHDTQLLYLRASELETIWDNITSKSELEDIYILHGADVALDIQALNFLDETDQQRYDVAKAGFEELYGFPFNDENEQKITNAPSEIRKTIDKRANLKFLRAWKWSSETGYLVDMCDAILKKWADRFNWYYPNVQLRQEYEELEELYINKRV